MIVRCKMRGFTLIEILTCIFIIGILLMLVIYAINASYETANRIMCTNNLKQFGLALNENATKFQNFGSPMPSRRFKGGASFSEFSGLYEMLPSIEQQNIYNSINIKAKLGVHDRANKTSLNFKINVFLCPSDNNISSVMRSSPLNYRFNVGSPKPADLRANTAISGAFVPARVSYPSDFRDGLSTTAGVSERVIGSQHNGSLDRFRDYWFSGASSLMVSPSSVEVNFICASLKQSNPNFHPFLGRSWAGNSFFDSWYNHVMIPNNPNTDCSFNSGSVSIGDFGPSAVTPRSYHGRYTNVLMMDGSVVRIANSVNLNLWRALGSRDAGEVVDENF